jgi:hypothetical protein
MEMETLNGLMRMWCTGEHRQVAPSLAGSDPVAPTPAGAE